MTVVNLIQDDEAIDNLLSALDDEFASLSDEEVRTVTRAIYGDEEKVLREIDRWIALSLVDVPAKSAPCLTYSYSHEIGRNRSNLLSLGMQSFKRLATGTAIAAIFVLVVSASAFNVINLINDAPKLFLAPHSVTANGTVVLSSGEVSRLKEEISRKKEALLLKHTLLSQIEPESQGDRDEHATNIPRTMIDQFSSVQKTSEASVRRVKTVRIHRAAVRTAVRDLGPSTSLRMAPQVGEMPEDVRPGNDSSNRVVFSVKYSRVPLPREKPPELRREVRKNDS